MNTLKYKGFIGSVAFSEADGVFFGKIEGIDGLVNFEGESVAELTNGFHEAVDDYLAYCEEEGIEPHKSYSGSLNVRLTPDIHTRVAYLAKQAGMSINSFIRTAVESRLQLCCDRELPGSVPKYQGDEYGVCDKCGDCLCRVILIYYSHHCCI